MGRISAHRAFTALPLAPPTDITRCLPLWPNEIADRSLEGRRRLVQKLERALREERRRGLAGHWTYDVIRHRALLTCWKREVAELTRCELAAKKQRPTSSSNG